MKRLNVLIPILILLIPLGLAVASQFTPLPSEIRITPPSPDLPQNIASFSGTWYGIWDNGQTTTLVVEKIEPPKAIAIYSWGMHRGKEGGWRRYEWKVEGGKLEVNLDEITITYSLSEGGDKLEGEYRSPSKSQINYVIMQRQPPASISPLSIEGPTPLPVNTKIIPPTQNIPKDIAAFSGTWQGVWDNGRSTTLVVEKINPPEAITIYSWGPWKDQTGGWKRYIGEIKQGRLKLYDPERETTIIYLLSKDGLTLEGTWKRGWTKLKATMRKQ